VPVLRQRDHSYLIQIKSRFLRFSSLIKACYIESHPAFRGAQLPEADSTRLMSIQCSSCGFNNPPGMRFCGNCGTRLPVTSGLLGTAAAASPALSPEHKG